MGRSVAGAESRRGRGSLETEALTALWASDAPMTVGEVQQAIAGELAHTTVQTILVRLCEKGAVTRERAGRGHAYRPVLAETDLAAQRMLRVLEREPDRSAVLQRFVADLRPEDEATLTEALRGLREPAPGRE